MEAGESRNFFRMRKRIANSPQLLACVAAARPSARSKGQLMCALRRLGTIAATRDLLFCAVSLDRARLTCGRAPRAAKGRAPRA